MRGGSGVKSLLGKARKQFKKENFDEASNLMAEVSIMIQSEIDWRKEAVTQILPILDNFQEETASNIGRRGQERLPDFLVPRISRCKSSHQDISLSF